MKLDLPFTISPSVSGIEIHSDENEGNDYIELNGWFHDRKNHHERIRINFIRMIGIKTGDHEERTEDAIGIIEKSKWLQRVISHRSKLYPDSKDNYKDIQHYYFAGHDMTVEVLAENIEWESIRVLHGDDSCDQTQHNEGM